ncbi:TRAP transporter small permease [Polynucleobacter sp. UB-Tiil-W10]|uniref:TRAP transporter small permease n=1 Tax=Polynucleobacter sp. UB-Tiil-W10 TaxID=1855648 RepID=UPI001C0B72E8|nr:TRAP transporter small permease [Polynucleobacter sp. UB-Tiil-W10]MBU3539870.1 TRAP transporter small permease [Polynucleobacter sp. UB-Tiil-W10]
MTQLLQATDRLMSGINKFMVLFGSLALVAASVILSYSVASRAFFGATTDWQDEAAVFCLVGATFLCGAYVQQIRGHVGISAVSTMLPKTVNQIRVLLIDIASCAFCAFFAWKSWTLFHEAWVDGQVTSSSWAPPLWIPYIMMSIGMTLLAVQILLQAFGDVVNPGEGE